MRSYTTNGGRCVVSDLVSRVAREMGLPRRNWQTDPRYTPEREAWARAQARLVGKMLKQGREFTIFLGGAE